MEIELDLKKVCVETATKSLHSRLITEYFQSKGENKEIEAKLVLLQKALKYFDFPALRKNYIELSGKSDSLITLMNNGNSPPVLSIDRHPVDISHCSKR